MENTTGRMPLAGDRTAAQRMRGLALAGAAALLLAGCATASSPAPGDGALTEPAPEGIGSAVPIDPEEFGTPQVAWIEEGATFQLTTWGSSSCPAEVDEMRLDAPDLVTVQLAAPSDDPCTADMAPHEQPLDLPAGADGRPLRVEIRSSDGDVQTGLELG